MIDGRIGFIDLRFSAIGGVGIDFVVFDFFQIFEGLNVGKLFNSDRQRRNRDVQPLFRFADFTVVVGRNRILQHAQLFFVRRPGVGGYFRPVIAVVRHVGFRLSASRQEQSGTHQEQQRFMHDSASFHKNHSIARHA